MSVSTTKLPVHTLWRTLLCASIVAVAGMAAAGKLAAVKVPKWWDPLRDTALPAYAQYDNPYGKLGVLNEAGEIGNRNHPFLSPIGKNGRACVTCHQPGNAMSVSVDSLRARWQEAGYADPVFAAIDGSNCPTLPQEQRASHSLLLDHGLFRVTRPWPPRDLSGRAIKPEFTIEVVSDPTGCNGDPRYGLHSAEPTISVYRRPRITANMRFVTSDQLDTRAIIGNKTGLPRARDPETGKFIFLPILADGGQPSTRRQSTAAATSHLGLERLTPEQLAEIDAFLNQIFVAQDFSKDAGKLSGPTDYVSKIGTAGDHPPLLGTGGFKGAPGLVTALYEDRELFGSFNVWRYVMTETPEQKFRASVVRGYDIFTRRPLMIRDVAGFTDIGMGNPYKRTCLICHNGQMSGIDRAPGFMDIGVQTEPRADPQPHLPLFKLTCDASAPPHPYLGRVVYTHDPGRALVSGRCAEIGSINLAQIRGLAARAPYFSSGAAKDLPALVDFYNRRFDLKLTAQEKIDLVNFLSVL